MLRNALLSVGCLASVFTVLFVLRAAVEPFCRFKDYKCAKRALGYAAISGLVATACVVAFALLVSSHRV